MSISNNTAVFQILVSCSLNSRNNLLSDFPDFPELDL